MARGKVSPASVCSLLHSSMSQCTILATKKIFRFTGFRISIQLVLWKANAQSITEWFNSLQVGIFLYVAMAGGIFYCHNGSKGDVGRTLVVTKW